MGQYQQADNAICVKSGEVVFQQGHIYEGSQNTMFNAKNSILNVSAYILPTVKTHFELDSTLKDVDIKVNFGLINDINLL